VLFDPRALSVDGTTGKLFHPSPSSSLHGARSLLRSALALELGSGMAGAHAIGWQLQWQGQLIQVPEINHTL
jgi:hypothetical protein